MWLLSSVVSSAQLIWGGMGSNHVEAKISLSGFSPARAKLCLKCSVRNISGMGLRQKSFVTYS